MQKKVKYIVFMFLGISFFVLVFVFYLEPVSTRIVNKNNFTDDDNIPLSAISAKAKTNKKTKAPKSNNPSFNFSSTFSEPFDATNTLKESGSMNSSNSADWWLNSGGYLYSADGEGRTVLGALDFFDPWRVAYALSNPTDTGGGYYPQNIFRLINKRTAQDMDMSAYFKIVATNKSTSPNNNQSNGLFLMSRYLDGNNLYYTGVRIDGTWVVKKKKNGQYYTLAQGQINDTSVVKWNKETNINLLPENTWIGVRHIILNDQRKVVIDVYLDIGRTGRWEYFGRAIDDGSRFGGDAHLSAGHFGLRTDFMDVYFDSIEAKF